MIDGDSNVNEQDINGSFFESTRSKSSNGPNDGASNDKTCSLFDRFYIARLSIPFSMMMPRIAYLTEYSSDAPL